MVRCLSTCLFVVAVVVVVVLFVCLFGLFVCLSLCCVSGSSSVYSFVFFSLQSPEFFYSCVKSDLGLTSVFDVLKFTDALEKLVG